MHVLRHKKLWQMVGNSMCNYMISIPKSTIEMYTPHVKQHTVFGSIDHLDLLIWSSIPVLHLN